MDYQLTTTDVILRLDDNACIPKDESNADYQEYLEWAKTNTPQNEPTPEAIPDKTAEEKLAQIGLTKDELKTLLGVAD